MRRVVTALAVAIGTLGASGATCWAGGVVTPTHISGMPTANGVVTTVATVSVTGGSGDAGALSVAMTCEYRTLLSQAIHDLSTLDVGDLVMVRCNVAGSAPAGAFTVDRWDPGAPPPVSPEVLGDVALAQLVVPLPDPVMAPPPNNQLTGLTTWLHLPGWDERSVTASAGGVSVTAHARPIEARWSFPDGSVTCHGPGPRWSSSVPDDAETSCGHTPVTASFTRDVPDEMSVAVTWDRWWTSSTGATTDVGPLTRTTTQPLVIREYQVTTR